MRFRYDPEADALYIRFQGGDVVETDEVFPGVMLDVDNNGNPFKLFCLMDKDQLKFFVSDKLETGVAHNLIYNNNLGDGFVQKLLILGIPVQSSCFDIYFVYHIVFSESQYAHPSGMLY